MFAGIKNRRHIKYSVASVKEANVWAYHKWISCNNITRPTKFSTD